MDIIRLMIFFLTGLVFGAGLVLVFRRMPEHWLMDYGDDDPAAAAAAKQRFARLPGIFLLILADGLIFAIAWHFHGPDPELAVMLYLAQPLLLIMVADLLTKIIPDQLVLALLPGGIALWLIDSLDGRSGWLAGLGLRLLAGLAAGAFLFGCGWLAAKIMHREAMGMGDVKLLAACGFLTGLTDLPFLFFLSFITAAVVAVPMLLKRMRHPDAEPEIAFGPYIALATLLVLVLNSQLHELWQLYLGLAVT